MRKKKIVLIEVKSAGVHVFSRVRIPRLGAMLLGTILHQKGYEVKVYIEDIFGVSMPDVLTADYVAISTITPTAVRAYELADEVRRAGIPVVMGGPHVSFLPEEALEHCDYVIRGEGERSLPSLLEALEHGKPLCNIKGISYKQNGQIVNTELAEYECDLDAFPSPDYSLVVGWGDKQPVASIATSRGCPFACKFCSVIQMFGRKIRFHSIDRIISEIKHLAPRCEHLFFCDDNFTMQKERTKILLKRMIAEGLIVQWSTQVRVDAARDEELLGLMKRSGCYTVFIGFESVNPQTLDSYHKKQTIDDIRFSIERFHHYGIHIHGMFVLGSDHDRVETIHHTTAFAKSNSIDTVQFLMLTPLPGTPMFEEIKEQGRIINWDWSKYDAHHTVFEPKNMSAYELQIETLKAMKKFYSYRSILRYLLKKDTFYAYLTRYGKTVSAQALKEKQYYADYLKTTIQKKYFQVSQKYINTLSPARLKIIGLTNLFIGENLKKFLPLFLERLRFQVLMNEKAGFPFADKTTLTRTQMASMLEHCRQQITRLADKVDCIIVPFTKDITASIEEHRNKVDETINKIFSKTPKKCIAIELNNNELYKICIELGIALNVSLKQVRKAYYKTKACAIDL
jgi:radical SAM superfamily enzyme YgiQ (UPF0313 family)